MPEARQSVKILGEDESYYNVPIYTDAYGRIRVAELVTGTISVIQSGTINYVANLGGTSDVRLAVDALSLMKTTGGTVSIGGTAVLSTTSTVPVSFAATSTVQIPLTSTVSIYPFTSSSVSLINTTSTIQSIIFGNTSTAGLVVAGGTIQVNTEFDTTSTLNISPSSTVNIPVSSTVNFLGSALSTTSTVPVSFAATSTLGAAVSWAVGSTINVPPSGTQQVDLRIITGIMTGTIPVTFAATSTLGAAVSWATGSTMNVPPSGTQQVDIRVDTVGLMKTTGGTVSIGGTAVLSTTSTVPVFIGTTGTVGVVFAATSTLGAAVSWAAGSTVNVSFAATSTLGAAVTGAVTLSGSGSTVQAQTPTNQTGTIPISLATANTTVTTSALSVTTTAATIPASAARKYLLLRNLGANTVLLKHAATASTIAYDLYLKTDDGMEYNQTNLWAGYISYIASTLTSTMTCLEW